MADDKKRPMAERIAALMGNSAFIDLRDGGGGTNPMRIKHQDIAAALGFVAQREGKVAALVLETHYGSTLLHLDALLRAWEDKERQPRQSEKDVILTRFGGELAIRELAHIRYGTPQLAHYAYLIFSRRETLQQRVTDAGAWLEQLRDAGLREFKRSLREVIEERKSKAP